MDGIHEYDSIIEKFPRPEIITKIEPDHPEYIIGLSSNENEEETAGGNGFLSHSIQFDNENVQELSKYSYKRSCLICHKQFLSTGPELGDEEIQSEEILDRLASVLEVSPSIYQNINIDEVPAPLVCTSCHETVSFAFKFQKEMKQLEKQLNKLSQTITKDLMHSFHLDSQDLGGIIMDPVEVKLIRKTYAQCLGTCEVRASVLESRQSVKPSSTRQPVVNLDNIDELRNSGCQFSVETFIKTEEGFDLNEVDFRSLGERSRNEVSSLRTINFEEATNGLSGVTSVSQPLPIHIITAADLRRNPLTSFVTEASEQSTKPNLNILSKENIDELRNYDCQLFPAVETIIKTEEDFDLCEDDFRSLGERSRNEISSIRTISSAEAANGLTGAKNMSKPLPITINTAAAVGWNPSLLTSITEASEQSTQSNQNTVSKEYDEGKESLPSVSTQAVTIGCSAWFPQDDPNTLSTRKKHVSYKEYESESNSEQDSHFDPDPSDSDFEEELFKKLPVRNKKRSCQKRESCQLKQKEKDPSPPQKKLNFGGLDRLERHLDHQNDGTDFSCKLCPAKFPKEFGLSTHIRLCHIGNLQCGICLKIFASFEEVESHKKSEHAVFSSATLKGKRHQCNICSKFYASKQSFKRHLKLHDTNAPMIKKFQCNICQRDFCLEDKYDLHMKMHANPDEIISQYVTAKVDEQKNLISFDCKVCKKIFTQDSHLNSESQVEIACDYKNCGCNETFSDLKTYMYHHKKVCLIKYGREHFKAEMVRRCELCGKDFLNARCLVLHKYQMHPGPDSYACQYCGRAFAKHALLQRHIRKHLPDRNVECHLCGKKVKCNNDLKSHVKFAHTNLRLPCEVCGKEFKNKRYLGRHIETMHSETKVKIPCHICGKLFKNKEYVRNHVYKAHQKRRKPRESE